MKLLLLRHAEAVPGADLDAARVLTAAGEAQAAAMALRVSALFAGVHVVSSPWQRAQQTAARIAQSEGCLASVSSALTPEVSVETAAAALEVWFSEVEALVVVTHQPLCGRLINWLIEGDKVGVSIAPCSGALLELEWPAQGMARLLNWYDGQSQE